MKKVLTVLIVMAMVTALFTGCATKKSEKTNVDTTKNEVENTATPGAKEIKEFTAFLSVEGAEINDDNEIQQKIAEIIGAKVKETWLTGQTQEEAIGMLIASGEYPDFIEGGNSTPQLIDAGALVAIDEYWDKYPNIKNFWPEKEWDKLRTEDGHIYFIPQFGNNYIKATDTQQNGEAFWIQTRVLKWAGYPKIESLDQLFKLLGDYYAANPTMADGTPVIPYEILTDDWYYFCLENPPQFLDGYPNDGSVIVDPTTFDIVDYNTTDTAIRYFKKMNEEYKKGIVDPEFMTMSRDQYIEKISSGRVLAMVDQHWNFQTGEDSVKSLGLNDCTYVPLGITIDPGMGEKYYTTTNTINVSSGLAITTSCKDVEGALQFVNDLLSKEVTTLRSWGIEGVDYAVDEAGLFYRTQEMRDNAVNAEYKASHLCTYSYFPNYQGMNLDEINAATPDRQPSEFFDSLSAEVQECLSAYGAKTYIEMLDYNEISTEDAPWFPMWTYSNSLTTGTKGGMAWTKMGETKHEWLPKVVIAEDFDTAWADYMKAYKNCKPEDFLGEMQEEVYKRIENVTGKNVRP
ncbi:MAG: carbohydrate transporter substrate-binding protein family [Anaerocolumna sp.]|nr:carbohydrate transporter substrate-binding protein family [Anaerocolumna sp.]